MKEIIKKEIIKSEVFVPFIIATLACAAFILILHSSII